MLALLIPNGRYGHKGRRHSALGKSQKKPDCCEAGKAFRCYKTHTDNTPENDCDPNELREWELRHQIDEGELGHQLADIKD